MRGAKVECVWINMSYLDLSLNVFILVFADFCLVIVALGRAPN